MQQDEIILDGSLLAQAFRRKLRLWLWLGPLIAGLMLLAASAIVPCSYTADVSVAIQQPLSSASPLALLGGGGANKRYIGVLKSRDVAQAVAQRVQLQSLYGLKSEEDAVDLLMRSIKPDDNAAEGLLYIRVSLPGPPRLSTITTPTPTQVKDAAALTANSYALALKEYYATDETDQAQALLDQAKTEQAQARSDYDAAVAKALAFTRNLRYADVRSVPSSVTLTTPGPGETTTGTAEAVASGLGSLYASLAQVQTELKAAQTVRQTHEELVGKLLRNLPNVPTDDPLLGDIRARVKQDQADYQTFSNLYGPENPRVIGAQTRLSVDQAELRRQTEGVKDRLTTSSVRSDEEIQSLYARQAALVKQITSESRQLGVHRELTGEMGRLQAEVDIRLEVLKATMSGAARVRLENASAKSRMSIIDEAIPPPGGGSPGILLLAVICLALVFAVFCLAVVREYFRSVHAAREEAAHHGLSLNGSGAKLPQEAEEAAPSSRRR